MGKGSFEALNRMVSREDIVARWELVEEGREQMGLDS
jgi:hypothetical protein